MKNNSGNHPSKTTVRKRNKLVYGFFYSLLTVYYALSGIRIHAVNKCGHAPKGPCIVLCNHGSFIDFYYAARLLRRTDCNFITARLYFYHKWLGGLLRQFGCFPKSMFATDLESTKNSMRVLKEGRVLAMMPEARLSTAGRFEDIQSGTYSFLKKSGVPVYTIVFRGDYFADPKWGKGLRRGSYVEAQLDLLFTPEQLEALSTARIKAAVEDRLYYDEFTWLESQPKVRYRNRRLAEGLENILTLCPQCGKQHTIQTKGNGIFCENCGALTTLTDRYGFPEGFTFSHFGQWYDWQYAQLESKILSDPDFSMTSPVQLRMADPSGRNLTRAVGDGTCTLTREGLTYTGTRDGAPYSISFPLHQIYRLLFGAGENFEVYQGAQIFYFVPRERRSAVDWYMASRILYDQVCKN